MAAVENIEKKLSEKSKAEIVVKLESLITNIARKIPMSDGGCCYKQ